MGAIASSTVRTRLSCVAAPSTALTSCSRPGKKPPCRPGAVRPRVRVRPYLRRSATKVYDKIEFRFEPGWRLDAVDKRAQLVARVLVK